jgi:flavorubredoxin
MPKTLNYSIQRGEVWERLIMVKDRRTRRVRKPMQASACILISGVSYAIPSVITAEGGILLEMTPAQTKWLVDGSYAWDGVATISRAQNFTSIPTEETVVFKGTLTVSSYDSVTPMEYESLPAEPLTPVV